MDGAMDDSGKSDSGKSDIPKTYRGGNYDRESAVPSSYKQYPGPAIGEAVLGSKPTLAPKTIRFDMLGKAVTSSFKTLSPYREMNRELVRKYTGSEYAGSGKQKFVNKMNQAVDAYTLLLAANSPKVEFETKYSELESFARHFSVAMNNLISEIDLSFTLRRWVLDGFFGIGVVKVHLADSGEVVFENDIKMDPGTPYASNVSLDNFVYDTTAKSWGEVRFAGDIYRIPFADLKAGIEEGIYDEAAAKLARPSGKEQNDHDSLESISQHENPNPEEIEPMITLADIWVPREQRVYTFIVRDRGSLELQSQPIAAIELGDPDFCPYHILGFNEVPDNIMPLSIASQLAPLDVTINNLMRKQVRQAMRQKKVGFYTPGVSGDAKNFKNASDGDLIESQNPKEIGEMNFGGPDANNHNFMLHLLDAFNIQAGNLTALLGLGAQSDTVGQEKLIHDAGSRKIGQMQARVMEATRKLVQSLGFLLWEDEFKVIAGSIQVDGAEEYQIDSTWRPGERAGNFFQYNLKINVQSMTYRPPGQQVEMINGLLTQVFIPMSEMLASQGGSIDFAKLTELYADALDLPKFKSIVTFANAQPTDSPSPSSSTRKGSNTTRNYIRKSVGNQNQPPPPLQQPQQGQPQQFSAPTGAPQ